MPHSRLSRLEDRKEKRRLTFAVAGILGIIVLVLLFGLQVLIGFSVFVEKLKGASPTPTQNQSLILPPILDPPAEATNSATISVTGSGEANLSLIVYLNEAQFNKLTVPTDGKFSINSIPLSEGVNTISAKLSDDKGASSDLSNVVTVSFVNTPPALEVNAPADNANVSGEPNSVEVSGTTDDNVTISINDRLVVVKSDNSFSYSYPLNDGDNILTVVATDTAGNQTTQTRKVIYHR